MAEPITKEFPVIPRSEENTRLNPSLEAASRAEASLPETACRPQIVRPIPVKAREEDIKERVSEVLREARQSASAAYDWAESRLTHAYHEASQSAEHLVRRANARVRYVCNNYPLHVVAAAGGIAFVAGVLLRIGRSKRNA